MVQQQTAIVEALAAVVAGVGGDRAVRERVVLELVRKREAIAALAAHQSLQVHAAYVLPQEALAAEHAPTVATRLTLVALVLVVSGDRLSLETTLYTRL